MAEPSAGKVDKVERLGNLVTLLLDTPRPLPLRVIVGQVPGYPPAAESARAAFERDKKELRAEGIEILTVGEGEDAGYRIDPATYYLPDLGLDEDEALALNLAASAVRFEDDDPDEALWKLGAPGAEGPPLVALPFDERLPRLHGAVRDRRPVAFRYHDVDREVEPYGLLCRDGFWYVIGHDRTRGEQRTFRVDRIDGDVELGPGGAVTVPDGFDPAAALPEHAYELAPGEAVVAEVAVDRLMAPRVVREVGDGAVRERRDDGSVVVAIPVRSRPGLRSWLFGLLDHARVVGPPALVDEVTGWLRAVAGEGPAR